MLPRSYRLTKKTDFEKAYRSKWAVGGRFVLVKIITNQLGHNRVGIVISKKVSPKANQRNKTKRWLRQIVRNFVIKNNTELDIVIACKASIKEADYQSLKEDWQSICLKINP
jgi:ribonuclease P protein component